MYALAHPINPFIFRSTLEEELFEHEMFPAFRNDLLRMIEKFPEDS